MTTLQINLPENSYPITVGKKLLESADKYFNLNRKVLIVTDDGVPNIYAKTVANLCSAPIIKTVKSGESSKSFETLEELLATMLDNSFGRGDCVLAVGGGVVGDLSGFAASVYMRGVDFYNIPTTLLSQVDSSIGGKTAINFGGVKNVIGAFRQPKCVLVDTDTLKTLPKRHFSSGLAEAIKMSITSDRDLFELFKSYSEKEIYDNIEDIIVKSLAIKKKVVEADEKETGLRKILNFGHTLGHGIEAEEGMSGLYHGECVALGILPVCGETLRKELVEVLKKIGLPYQYKGDVEKALSYVTHDKKCHNGCVSVIKSKKAGSYAIEEMKVDEFKNLVKTAIFDNQ